MTDGPNRTHENNHVIEPSHAVAGNQQWRRNKIVVVLDLSAAILTRPLGRVAFALAIPVATAMR